MATTIEVTAEDIAKGTAACPHSLAVVLSALNRVYVRDEIEVRRSYAWIGGDSFEYPQELLDALDLIECGGVPVPFSFTLDADP